MRPKKIDIEHGRYKYERDGCRCSVCRAAIAKHSRDFQAKNREKIRTKDRARYAANSDKYKERARLRALRIKKIRQGEIIPSPDFKHGRWGYAGRGCRCRICTKAATEYLRKYLARKREKKAWLEDGFKHNIWGYQLGCRCEVCIAAEAEKKRTLRNRNIERTRERERAYLRRHAEEHRRRVIKYNREHPESQKARSRRYNASHLEQRREYRIKYYKEHADRMREVQRNYQRSRGRSDLSYRICRNLRTRVRGAIARGSKSASTLVLLGCSIPELKEKLASLFAAGMNWDNYGEWTIDHIIPCTAFDLTIPVNQRACFNWRNLQPLWKADNQRKGNSILPGVDVDSYVGQFGEGTKNAV